MGLAESEPGMSQAADSGFQFGRDGARITRESRSFLIDSTCLANPPGAYVAMAGPGFLPRGNLKVEVLRQESIGMSTGVVVPVIVVTLVAPIRLGRRISRHPGSAQTGLCGST